MSKGLKDIVKVPDDGSIKEWLLAPVYALYGFLNVVKVKTNLKWIFQVVLISGVIEIAIGMLVGNEAQSFGYMLGAVFFLIWLYILQPNKSYESAVKMYAKGFKKYQADKVLNTIGSIGEKSKETLGSAMQKVGDYIQIERVEEDNGMSESRGNEETGKSASNTTPQQSQQTSATSEVSQPINATKPQLNLKPTTYNPTNSNQSSGNVLDSMEDIDPDENW